MRPVAVALAMLEQGLEETGEHGLRNRRPVVRNAEFVIAPDLARRSVIRPDGGQKSTAFSTSLSSICAMRSGAPRIGQASAGVSSSNRDDGKASL